EAPAGRANVRRRGRARSFALRRLAGAEPGPLGDVPELGGEAGAQLREPRPAAGPRERAEQPASVLAQVAHAGPPGDPRDAPQHGERGREGRSPRPPAPPGEPAPERQEEG